MSNTNTHSDFPRERLDAYQVALEALVVATELANQLPRGSAKDGKQMVDAAASVVRNIAEGAGRWGSGEKRAKFSIARGEAGETASCAQYLATTGALTWLQALRLIHLEDRVAAMLTGLIKRHS
jgi:four helix bundle protein